jgi:hypothetical protein
MQHLRDAQVLLVPDFEDFVLVADASISGVESKGNWTTCIRSIL